MGCEIDDCTDIDLSVCAFCMKFLCTKHEIEVMFPNGAADYICPLCVSEAKSYGGRIISGHDPFDTAKLDVTQPIINPNYLPLWKRVKLACGILLKKA